MAKKTNKWMTITMGVFMLLLAFIVGGMFISGSTTGNVVLKYVPAVVHPIVGWLIVAIAGILGVLGVYRLVTKM